MRRLLRWLFHKTLDPPLEKRQEPAELRQVREDFRMAKSKAKRVLASGSVDELTRTERTIRRR